MKLQEAIQSANLHSHLAHARAKADAVEGKAEQPRPTLTFDGFGINGPDEYRSRLATFTNREEGKRWGPLLAAAPELLEVAKLAEYIAGGGYIGNGSRKQWDAKLLAAAQAAIAKAKGQQ